MELDQADALLRPDPLPLEMGVQRLDSGQILVAARTHMRECTGAMFEWWFRFAPDTEQYTWWHPGDHVSSRWWEQQPGTHVGSTHEVEERLAGGEVHHLFIQFHDDRETFSEAALADARETGAVSGLVCARIGVGPEPPRDAQGRIQGGRMTHVARDTPFGTVLRSRFWLPAELPEPFALDLMQHAYSEFFYLSRFLPALYIAEGRKEHPVPLPW
jgi:hypothetical protein